MQIVWRPTPTTLAPRLDAAAGAPLQAGEPAGRSELELVAVLGSGRESWERVAQALLSWDLHREARMVVAGEAVRTGGTVVTAAPFGPVAVLAPCRVLEVLDEPGRRGFRYAALPGHAVEGEEQFTAELPDDGLVRLRIRSSSRPVGLPGVLPPATRLGQRLINRRYVSAGRRLAR